MATDERHQPLVRIMHLLRKPQNFKCHLLISECGLHKLYYRLTEIKIQGKVIMTVKKYQLFKYIGMAHCCSCGLGGPAPQSKTRTTGFFSMSLIPSHPAGGVTTRRQRLLA